MYHEIEGAVVVWEIGRLRDDVVDIFEVFYAAFGGIKGYYGSTCAGNGIFNLHGALALLSQKLQRVAYLVYAVFRQTIGAYGKSELIEESRRALEHSRVLHG